MVQRVETAWTKESVQWVLFARMGWAVLGGDFVAFSWANESESTQTRVLGEVEKSQGTRNPCLM